jgi:hypothetical protein
MSGDTRPQTDQHADADGDLGERNDDADRRGLTYQVDQQGVEGTRVRGGDELGLDRNRTLRAKEVRVGQFL